MEGEDTKKEKKHKIKHSKEEVKYYLPSDVIEHNKAEDIWVSFLGKVFDITPLVKEFQGKKEVKPLLSNAGKDISNWFDKKTQDIKMVVHPVTGLKVPYCPYGPIPHVQLPIPSTNWQPMEMMKRPYAQVPWWRDDRYFKGYLSKNPRPLKVVNSLLGNNNRNSLVWVASEETLFDIFKRLKPFNSEIHKYTFKFEGSELNMERTLDENEVFDERKKFNQLCLTDNTHVPAIQLYLKDDFE